jgi:Trk K+ transport system NAD-binding subunit
VDDPRNFGVFEAAGVMVVNPNDAVATEFAGALSGAPQLDALTMPEDNLEAVRITVSNPDAQMALEQIQAMRGTIALIVRRGGRGTVPNGKTRLQLGDQVTVFGPAAAVANARRALTLGGQRPQPGD